MPSKGVPENLHTKEPYEDPRDADSQDQGDNNQQDYSATQKY